MNSLIRSLGRVLLATPFIRLGWGAAQSPGGRVDMAAAMGVPKPEAAVRLNGAAMVVSGAALALGILPRWAALTLIGCLVPAMPSGKRTSSKSARHSSYTSLRMYRWWEGW